MEWILLEAGVALAIGLFIVWWTWPKKRQEPKRQEPPGDRRDDP